MKNMHNALTSLANKNAVAGASFFSDTFKVQIILELQKLFFKGETGLSDHSNINISWIFVCNFQISQFLLFPNLILSQ